MHARSLSQTRQLPYTRISLILKPIYKLATWGQIICINVVRCRVNCLQILHHDNGGGLNIYEINLYAHITSILYHWTNGGEWFVELTEMTWGQYSTQIRSRYGQGYTLYKPMGMAGMDITETTGTEQEHCRKDHHLFSQHFRLLFIVLFKNSFADIQGESIGKSMNKP